MSLFRWITSAACAAAVGCARRWRIKTWWALSRPSTSWPPERDSCRAGWTMSGRSSSPHCVKRVSTVFCAWIGEGTSLGNNRCSPENAFLRVSTCGFFPAESTCQTLGEPCTLLFHTLCESFVDLSKLVGRHATALSYLLQNAQSRDVTSFPLVTHGEHFLETYKK